MIHYDQGRFALMLAFKMKGSVLPTAALMAIGPAIAAAILTIVKNTYGEELPIWFFATGEEYSIYQGFSWVLGFILVFRTSQAYTRYWEGAQLLHAVTAEWYDACAQCTAFASTSEKPREEVEAFSGTLIRLFSLLHCSALQQISVMEDDKFLVIDAKHLSSEIRSGLCRFEHCRTQEDRRQRTEVIFLWITRFILKNMKTGMVNSPPPIVTRAFQELNSGMTALNRMVTITDTPLPLPYVQVIALLLICSMVLTPFVVAAKASHWVWASIFTFVAICMQWGINLIAAEIEQPFGDDDNDFDLSEAQTDFNDSLLLLVDSQVCWCMPEGLPISATGDDVEGRLSISNLTGSQSQQQLSQLFKDAGSLVTQDPAPPEGASTEKRISQQKNSEQNRWVTKRKSTFIAPSPMMIQQQDSKEECKEKPSLFRSASKSADSVDARWQKKKSKGLLVSSSESSDLQQSADYSTKPFRPSDHGSLRSSAESAESGHSDSPRSSTGSCSQNPADQARSCRQDQAATDADDSRRMEDASTDSGGVHLYEGRDYQAIMSLPTEQLRGKLSDSNVSTANKGAFTMSAINANHEGRNNTPHAAKQATPLKVGDSVTSIL